MSKKLKLFLYNKSNTSLATISIKENRYTLPPGKRVEISMLDLPEIRKIVKVSNNLDIEWEDIK